MQTLVTIAERRGLHKNESPSSVPVSCSNVVERFNRQCGNIIFATKMWLLYHFLLILLCSDIIVVSPTGLLHVGIVKLSM